MPIVSTVSEHTGTGPQLVRIEVKQLRQTATRQEVAVCPLNLLTRRTVPYLKRLHCPITFPQTAVLPCDHAAL